jgi:hypothetical protein
MTDLIKHEFLFSNGQFDTGKMLREIVNLRRIVAEQKKIIENFNSDGPTAVPYTGVTRYKDKKRRPNLIPKAQRDIVNPRQRASNLKRTKITYQGLPKLEPGKVEYDDDDDQPTPSNSNANANVSTKVSTKSVLPPDVLSNSPPRTAYQIFIRAVDPETKETMIDSSGKEYERIELKSSVNTIGRATWKQNAENTLIPREAFDILIDGDGSFTTVRAKKYKIHILPIDIKLEPSEESYARSGSFIMYSNVFAVQILVIGGY